MFGQRGLGTLPGEWSRSAGTLRVRANGCEFVSCDCVCGAQCSRAGVRQVPARGCPPVGVKYAGKEVGQIPAHGFGEYLTLRLVPPSASPLRPPLL